MVTWHHEDDGLLVVLKGGPQEVLALCHHRWGGNGDVPLTPADRQAILDVYERWAKKALRGLAVAYIRHPNKKTPLTADPLKAIFTFVGVFGIEDALRPEAAEAIRGMHRAGIRTIMVTGDYNKTGRAVAERLGLLRGQGEGQVLDGSDIDLLDDVALRKRLVSTTVATRLTPEHKLRIARLLKQDGEIVAMTGDGINDVPALLEANVGIAVGRSASAAAKEAADMLLVDGNFMSIVVAISEGRRIFRNIRRVIYYLLATSFGELILVMAALMIGLPLPLLPTQIIWLNAITGPFLALALAREPMAPSVMQERPHDPRIPIVQATVWRRIIVTGITIGISGLVVFWLGLQAGISEERLFAIILTTVVMAELVSAITARSSRRSTFMHFKLSRSMVLAILSVFVLQSAILYIPLLAKVFHVAPLSLGDWLIALSTGLSVLVVEEVSKFWFRRQSSQPFIVAQPNA